MIVDDKHWEALSKFKFAYYDGYFGMVVGKKAWRVHRYIWQILEGRELPAKHIVDHINRKRGDNRTENLRVVLQAVNAQNRSKRKGCTSKYRGVSFREAAGKWRASASKAGKTYELGLFPSEKEAARAFNRKTAELYGADAALNEISESEGDEGSEEEEKSDEEKEDVNDEEEKETSGESEKDDNGEEDATIKRRVKIT